MGEPRDCGTRGADAGSSVLSRPVDSDCLLDRVVRGVPPSSAREVAELFYVSFGLKLAGLVLPRDREAGIELLTSLFCLDEVYAALDGSGRLLGVAFVTGHDRVLCLSRDALAVAYGPFGGAWRYAVYRMLTARRRAYLRDVRGLEGFSVDPTCRGQGIGSAMIEQIAADARREGARAIELNVGDTNPARHLYERAGFRITRTGSVWPFARRLGFKRFVYYELELRPTADRSTGEST
jgi:ribosomal protein S18 acetylase RimI-like enzyme